MRGLYIGVRLPGGVESDPWDKCSFRLQKLGRHLVFNTSASRYKLKGNFRNQKYLIVVRDKNKCPFNGPYRDEYLSLIYFMNSLSFRSSIYDLFTNCNFIRRISYTNIITLLQTKYDRLIRIITKYVYNTLFENESSIINTTWVITIITKYGRDIIIIVWYA